MRPQALHLYRLVPSLRTDHLTTVSDLQVGTRDMAAELLVQEGVYGTVPGGPLLMAVLVTDGGEERLAGLLVQSHVHLPEQGYLRRNLVHRHKYTF